MQTGRKTDFGVTLAALIRFRCIGYCDRPKNCSHDRLFSDSNTYKIILCSKYKKNMYTHSGTCAQRSQHFAFVCRCAPNRQLQFFSMQNPCRIRSFKCQNLSIVSRQCLASTAFVSFDPALCIDFSWGLQSGSGEACSYQTVFLCFFSAEKRLQPELA